MNVILGNTIILLLLNTLWVVYLWWSHRVNLEQWDSMIKWMKCQEEINALHRQRFASLEKELNK